MENFISLKDVKDRNDLLKKAFAIKKNPHNYKQLGKNKTLGLLFFNPSLRTRMSAQIAARNIDMEVIVLNLKEDSWALEFKDKTIMKGNKAEHIKEAAGVISTYFDIVGIRSFASLKDREGDYSEKILKAFHTYCSIPVLSLESATLHPLQSFADWMTIEEHKKKNIPKVVLSWAPHPKPLSQAVANSFLEWMRETEIDLSITHPKGLELCPKYTQGVPIFYQQEEALRGADFVYVKNWSCYNDYGEIKNNFNHWMMDMDKMEKTNNGKLMHCLPVRRNVVVSDAVLDSGDSLVFKQANNRIYTAQTILIELLKNEK